MTNLVLAFDIFAAFSFVYLLTRANKEEKTKYYFPKYVKMLWIRRIVYTTVSILLIWRIVESIDNEREISFIGASVNIVLTSSLLILAYARIKLELD